MTVLALLVVAIEIVIAWKILGRYERTIAGWLRLAAHRLAETAAMLDRRNDPDRWDSITTCPDPLHCDHL